MPFVRLEMLTGRSQAIKAALVRDLTEVVARHSGSDPEHVQVLIVEHPAQNWALAGRMLADDTVADHDG